MSKRFAATIWVEGPSREAIDAMRRKWDSAVADTGPHTTVVYPDAVPDARSIEARARALIGSCPSFDVRLDRIVDLDALAGIDPAGTAWLREMFPAFRNPVVLLPVDGTALLDLRRRLDPIFDQPAAVLASPPFVTISQGLDEDAARAVVRELAGARLDFRFTVHAVDLLEIDEAGAWTSVATIALDGAGSAPHREARP